MQSDGLYLQMRCRQQARGELYALVADVFGDGLSGLVPNLQGPDDPPGVILALVQGHGVDFPELGYEGILDPEAVGIPKRDSRVVDYLEVDEVQAMLHAVFQKGAGYSLPAFHLQRSAGGQDLQYFYARRILAG